MFARLAVAMRVKDADAIQIGVYYDALAEFPLARVRDAAQQWMQTGKFFPTTGEWATAIREIREGTPMALWTPTVTLLCEGCQDTGWVYKDCAAGQRCGQAKCLAKGADWSHVYVVRCACFTADPA